MIPGCRAPLRMRFLSSSVSKSYHFSMFFGSTRLKTRLIIREKRSTAAFSVFLPWKKYKKVSWMYFCHGRNTKMIVGCVSSMEEIHKTLYLYSYDGVEHQKIILAIKNHEYKGL